MSCESKVERNDPGRIDEEAIAEVAMLSDGTEPRGVISIFSLPDGRGSRGARTL